MKPVLMVLCLVMILRGDFPTHDNASPYGANDMAGSVYEWIKDYYQER